MAAGIMGPIDGSVVNVALPTIGRVFNADLNTVGWVAMAYLLVLGSLILTYGRLGDMYGFRRVLLLGIAIFTAASGMCALAPNIWVLIAFRAIQAIGAGMLMAMGPAIVTWVFPPQERGRALGFFSLSAFLLAGSGSHQRSLVGPLGNPLAGLHRAEHRQLGLVPHVWPQGRFRDF